MEIQELVNKAQGLKKQGQLREALKCYDDALSALFQEALSYAHSKGGVIDEGGTRKVLPKNFKLVQEYLKQGEDVAMILNNMGTICAELKDFEKAKQYFSEAIELIPDGSGYKDPYLGLEAIKDLQST